MQSDHIADTKKMISPEKKAEILADIAKYHPEVTKADVDNDGYLVVFIPKQYDNYDVYASEVCSLFDKGEISGVKVGEYVKGMSEIPVGYAVIGQSDCH